ncbi:hypothetical protein [Ktedonobacter robiniae]|uniref:Helix-turn-helix domain-containing protein n=1 Tax=Ktedonobacter robiniae TaxID=2778365 RepID=A0ABQ3V619_9CHLR|nr:hypothetical protein [Ktedonobacter robiniae]GHO60644.1 hypothetical protein KSB_91190 [Ktedonobacter robiniae]
MTHDMLEHPAFDTQERYVDELVDEHDYWLSLTDAVRVTRRQDVTIRRWVKSGLLPVRRQNVGLNQRTRQVRASDLAQLTPIIDNSAVITSEQAQLNLTNIPGEQAALRESHQRILQQLEELHQELEAQGKQHSQALAEQVQQQQQALSLFHDQVEQRLDTQQEEMLGQLEEQAQTLRHVLDSQKQQFEQVQQRISEQTQRLDTQEQLITQLRETVEQYQATSAQAQQELTQQQQEVFRFLEEQHTLFTELTIQHKQLEERTGQLDEVVQTLSTQIIWQGELVQQQYQNLTTSLATWSEQADTWQQETATRLAELQNELQQAARAHEDALQQRQQAFDESVALLREQVVVSHLELERIVQELTGRYEKETKQHTMEQQHLQETLNQQQAVIASLSVRLQHLEARVCLQDRQEDQE